MNLTHSNGTTTTTLLDPSVYVAWEKALLVLVPFLVWAVGILMYKRIRRQPNGESDTAASRLLLFYNLAAGIMWGQFFFHALPHATTYGYFGYGLNGLFVLLGYSIIKGYNVIGRTCHDNKNFVGKSPTSISTEFTLRSDVQEDGEYFRMSGNSNGGAQWDVGEEDDGLGRRRTNAHIYYITLIFTCLADGLFLTYNSTDMVHGVMILVFAIDKIIESIGLYTVLLHSRMHTRRGCNRRWFYTLFFGWPFIVFFSIMLILCNVTAGQAYTWINHLALNIFYSVFSGALLWYVNLFERMELEKPTRAQLRISYFSFVMMALLSGVTGYFV